MEGVLTIQGVFLFMCFSEFDLPDFPAGEQPARNPRPVSRGLKLQIGFLGLDSLYLVLEYPYRDVYDFWAAAIEDADPHSLYQGVVVDDLVVRRGALGYKLSVWDGDARLFMTDHVRETLENTPREDQGMGLMLQLGPKWLRQYGEIVAPQGLIQNALAQFSAFGVVAPERYMVRINRLDIAADIVGLDVSRFSLDEWSANWVGYAQQKHFYFASRTGKLEGFSVGSSKGAVRFKVYDKRSESMKGGSWGFWASVWELGAGEFPPVARFEWSIRCYEANFSEMRYLTQLTYEGFQELLNYVSLKWGRLCIPDPNDGNQSRWQLAPLWADLRELVEAWAGNLNGLAKRQYDFKPEIKTAYLRSVAGWLAGLQMRVALENQSDGAASLKEGLDYLADQGLTLPIIQRKANQKWQVASRLVGGKKQS